jgi:undecaprenyl-diphosphatase
MPLSILQIVILGLIQGAAELLPVSSSAHLIVAEKLMGLDPSSPDMTFLLAMLHTGTMFAVVAYFRTAWRTSFFSNREQVRSTIGNLAMATIYTLAIGFGLQELIAKVSDHNGTPTEIEDLFSRLPLIATALAAGGVLILIAGFVEGREVEDTDMPIGTAGWIGVVQGLTIPFRGFSRSGATISAGMLLKVGKARSEEFSFALVIILTPLVIGRELLRLLKAHAEATTPLHIAGLLGPGLLGMVCSFGAGLLALRLLSGWLKGGHWWYFGVYCLAASAGVFALAQAGF